MPRFDLSLASRRATENDVVHEAATAIREAGLGLKGGHGDPGRGRRRRQPNRILREDIGGHVIVRTGRRIPGVVPIGGAHFPISVVAWQSGTRTAQRNGAKAKARTRSLSEPSESSDGSAAPWPSSRFSMRSEHRAKVFGGPKYTLSARSTKGC